MYKAGKVPDSEGSGRTQEGTVSIRRNLKLAAPSRSPGKRADGETEKAKGRALGNSSAQGTGAARGEQGSHCTYKRHLQPRAILPQTGTCKKPQKRIRAFSSFQCLCPLLSLVFLFPFPLPSLISPSEGGLDEQRAPPPALEPCLPRSCWVGAGVRLTKGPCKD